ncbi:MAG: hypothetical protein OJF51_002410 [Nitrospira sp.]|jgi:hypothetical protein|nr:MAG: hypothetical protein OJF51_002410 [Nitrospira sp.]
MRRSADEVIMLLDLARELKKAMARARNTSPDVARRLAVRFEAVVRRVRDLEAGRRPSSWPGQASQDRRVGAVSSGRPFGVRSGRFGMAPDDIDLRNLCWSMIGR